MSIYSPAFADPHCTYPQRDGQAESTASVADYCLSLIVMYRYCVGVFRPVRSKQQGRFQALESQFPLCPQLPKGR